MADMNNDVMRWRELSVDGVRSICPHHDGEWVKFADIKDLLQTSPDRPSAPLCRCGDVATVHKCTDCEYDDCKPHL
jgi:hypothetical protein